MNPVINPIVKPAEPPEMAIVRGLAKLLDEAFTLPGTNKKIGLDPILGFIPVIGDLGSAAIGGYILMVASKLGVPPIVLWRMLLNLTVDTVVGAIPFVGDAFDVAFKANTMNAKLLAKSLAEPHRARRSSWGVMLLVGLGFAAVTIGGIAGTVYLVRWLTG
ncbi:MAG: DUF4112 domain-containing protein [Planctomycetaceae bacterium]|nr:DUF4112 domain-containing protein [Planctomycetaceae bacterium]